MGQSRASRGGIVITTVLLAAVLAGCGGGSSSSDGGGDGTPTGPTRTVTGFVGDWTTGQGIVGATVQIGGQSAQTGGTGQFSLANVPREDLPVTISAANYQSVSTTLPGSVNQINQRLLPASVGNVETPPTPPGL